MAGQRVHGTTRKVPLAVFGGEEQQALLPCDGEPYDVPDWRTATVHPDYHIAYRRALYSAPQAGASREARWRSAQEPLGKTIASYGSRRQLHARL